MTLIYIILTIVITAIIMIVLFVIIHDWKVKKPRIFTLDDAFPNQKQDIPLEEFEHIKMRLIEYLIAWGMDEKAKIDENEDTKGKAFLFHSADPAWDAILLWSIGNASRAYLSVSSAPTIEEFATLFIKSNFEEIDSVI